MDDERRVLPIDPDLGALDPAAPRVRPGPSAGSRHRNRARPGMLAAVGAGGMLGASARYGIARALPAVGGTFPWATFWTNISGSFVLGVLLILIVERLPPTRYLRPFAATGVVGAFTTMSTYQVETVLLLRSHHFAVAIVYSAASIVCGLFVAYLGMVAGRLSGRLTPARHETAKR